MADVSEKPHDVNGLTRRKTDMSKLHSQQKETLDVNTLQETIVRRVKSTLDKEKSQLIGRIERHISDLTEEVIREVQEAQDSNINGWNSFQNGFSVHNNNNNSKDVQEKGKAPEKSRSFRKGGKRSQFHDKIFQARESLLTELFQVKHISTVYHIFIAFLINLVVYSALYDIVKFGKLNLGLELIYWNFQKLPYAVLVWFGMQTSTLLVYVVFSFWANKRKEFIHRSWAVKIWDLLFLFLIIVYQGLFLTIPTIMVVESELPIASSFSLLMEQVRFVMKTYSFIRSNVPRVLAYKNHQSNPRAAAIVPHFSKYLYFLFVPTLIYKDEYPRTSHVRWNIVFQHLAEVVGVIFYVAFIMERYLIPLVKDFGKNPMTPELFIVTFFGINVPSLLIFLCGFYCLLHSWFNAFAEMLRFADRLFYKDWWNSSSFAEYYKTWNIVVHDWLYTYIYRDATENLTKNKPASMWLVFIVSALFHEFILAFTLRFCYPVLFIAFGIISTCLVFIPTRGSPARGNLLLWLSLCMGTGLCATLYMFEYYARINCPSKIESAVQDFFVPRSWTCHELR